jgi:hypothetical protein
MASKYMIAAFDLPDLSSTERLVLYYLAFRANGRGVCWPTRARIAKDCSLHPDTVKGILSGFVTKGLIVKETMYTDGRAVSAEITLKYKPARSGRENHGVVGSPPDGGTDEPMGGGSSIPPERVTETSKERSLDLFGLAPNDTHEEISPSGTKPKNGHSVRGSRIDPDWSPSGADQKYAADRGFRAAQIEHIAETFRDFWLAKAGPNGVKLDWAATWRTWVRNEAERHPPPAVKKVRDWSRDWAPG